MKWTKALGPSSFLAAVLLVGSVTGAALAFQVSGGQRSTQTPPPAPSPPIGPEQTLYMIRSTLMTLNDANRSGNYTVLRDLSAPDFQARNTDADLAQIFSDLRHRGIDLASVALINPQLTSAPALDGDGRMHMAGFFPTRPLQIRFDLTFQVVSGQWRLFAISVATPEAPKTP